MESLLVALPGLACAGGMGLMMWLMMRSQPGRSDAQRSSDRAAADRGLPSTDEQIAQLRDELARLRAEHEQPRSDEHLP